MGPLSAVAVSLWLVIYAATGITWISASPKFLGWLALIVAAVVIVDTFILNSGRWWANRRQPQ